MADREAARRNQVEAASEIGRRAGELMNTTDPQAARRHREVIVEQVDQAVEQIDVIHRIDDRATEEAIVC